MEGVKGEGIRGRALAAMLTHTLQRCYVKAGGRPQPAQGVWGWFLAVLCALLATQGTCFGQASSPTGPGSAISSDQPDLFGLVIANQKKLDSDLNVYERAERTEIRKTGSDAKPSEVKVWRVFPAGTGMAKIPLAPDGKPASSEGYAAALEKLETTLIWAAQDGSAQREAYGKVERKRKERNDLIDATRKAFFFTRVGEEMRGNRVLVKYEMTRNPAYKATTRNEMLFTRVQGTIWIDKESSQLAKVEGHVTEDISLALFLAKVYQGSYFMQERYELAPGVWLPTYQQYDFDGRKFLVPFSIHERSFYTDYRRVGPPSEAVGVVRDELGKLKSSRADP